MAAERKSFTMTRNRKAQLSLFDEIKKVQEYVPPERPKRYDPMERVEAPFTDEQVKLLERYQKCESVHPFTCFFDTSELVPSVMGWFCTQCDYTQAWCHAMMIDLNWIEMVENWKNRNKALI